MNKKLKDALQILAGALVVYVIYLLSLVATIKDGLTPKQKPVDHKVEVRMVDGWIQMAELHNRFYTTLNEYASNYMPIRPSYNRKGGIQFTYQFWINMRNADSSNVKFRDILLKGDPGVFNYRTVRFADSDFSAATGVTERVENKETVTTKCPRILFGPTFDSFQIELNTIHDLDARFIIRSVSDPSSSKGSSMRRNALKLAQDKWMLVTFTFEDHVAISAHEEGIIIRAYINDTLYATKEIASAMRPNRSRLHLFPGKSPISNNRIGNLKYYNRAINHEEVASVFSEGRPTKYANMNGGLGEQLRLSEHNKADTYNS
eukprot:gene10942-17056_t